MSQLLEKLGVKHSVLNAKNHEKEAMIVKDAGQRGAVTIATNMAGRGTDIKFGEGVVELGGLYVLGTERHESRRIDNQLRGRAGRQGDPGVSQFYVSMEDTIMRLFGGDRIKKMMEYLKVPEDMPIENKMLSNSIESAQKKIEGHHFDVRKHVLQYDDVMNVHRDIIYTRRKKFLESESIKEEILKMIEEEVEALVLNQTGGRTADAWDYQKITDIINAIPKNPTKKLSVEELRKETNENEVLRITKEFLLGEYEKIEKKLPNQEILRSIEKAVFLRSNDTLWMEHIDEMQDLRESVSMQGYGQRDPVVEYKGQAFQKFDEMVGMIRTNTVNTLFKIDLSEKVAEKVKEETKVANIQTNENEVESNITGTTNNPAIAKPNVIKVSAADTGSVVGASHTGQITSNKVGRNDPCPCGSGKKYKKCCGANEE